MSEQDCIFCQIGRGESPADQVFDDGTVFAIRNIHPEAPTHLLVIPYAHFESLLEASAEQRAIAAHCLAVGPDVAEQAGLASPGYRLVVNQGADSGQQVAHFHLHILGGRKLGYMA